MYALFIKECATNLNWCGRQRNDSTSPNNVGLKSMTIANVLMYVVRSRCTQATITDVMEKAAMSWLRNSRDLQGGGKIRRPSSLASSGISSGKD